MNRLAPGLVWCTSCQARTALKAAGGKCPVCDPSQGNQVSQNAADELERIDAVLAGDVHESWGSGQASWSADGSHQDLEAPDDWYASIIERLHERIVSIPRRYGRDALGDVVAAELGDRFLGLGTLVEEPQEPIALAWDGTEDGEMLAFPRHRLSSWSMTIPISTDQYPDLMRLFTGAPWGHELDVWADDGGSMASDG